MGGAEGFLLLALPRASLQTTKSLYTDCLYLECVTIPPVKAPFPDRDVYLVLRISNFEIALDPLRYISSSIQSKSHIYTFHATETEPQFEVSVPIPQVDDQVEDLETFDHILTQYAQFTPTGQSAPNDLDAKLSMPPLPTVGNNEYEDLRGRLVLINESDGSVVGELDNQFTIREDPAGFSKDDPVILELPPDYDARPTHGAPGSRAREAFVHAVPPGERDLLTHTASFLSHAISATTTLLLSGVGFASDYYIKNSVPAPNSESGVPSSSRSAPHGGVIISSPRTRTALTQAHAVSGTAVKISGKTIEVVEGLIKKAVGAKEGSSSNRIKRFHPLAHPPNYTAPYPDDKPPLPPRKGDSEKSGYPTSNGVLPPPLLDRGGPPPLPERLPLRKRDRIILSADLVLSTIEESARQALDVGQHEATKIVTHKHGHEAGQNAALATGTARNVALVYIDMRGIGRRAILKKTGKEFVKARVRSGRPPQGASTSNLNVAQPPAPYNPLSRTVSATDSVLPAYSETPSGHYQPRAVPPPPPPRPSEKKG